MLEFHHDKKTLRRRGLLRAGLAGVASTLPWGLTACAPREMAPDVTFVRLDGSAAKLSDWRGKVVLVNFWATSCASCVAEMPDMVRTHQQFQAQGYETLAVAMSYDPPAYVANFTKQRQLPFTVAIDNLGEIARAFGDVKITPTHFLLDKQGRVVKRYVGPPDFAAFRAKVEKLLAEQS